MEEWKGLAKRGSRTTAEHSAALAAAQRPCQRGPFYWAPISAWWTRYRFVRGVAFSGQLVPGAGPLFDKKAGTAIVIVVNV